MGRNDNYEQVIREAFPFHLLADDQFARLLKDAERQSFSENEFILHEQDEKVEIYFLLKGLAKNVLHRENGQQFSVRFYYPGDLIGLMILLAGGEMNFSVQALENCETVKLSKNTMLKIMNENEEFSTVILSNIGERMKSLYDEIKKERDANDSENITLFRTKVHAIMDKAETVVESASLQEAASLAAGRNAAGLTVVNEKNELLGVITQQQLIRALINGNDGDTVSLWMERHPHTIQEDAFSYEVLTFFKDDYIDIVPVMNGEYVVGVLTAESFLQLQDSKYLNLSYKMQHAAKLPQLEKLSPKKSRDFHEFTSALLDNRTPATEVCEFISSYNDQLHRKLIQLCLREMEKEGFGKPPVNYCFIVMGSQGRKEQAFSTDQDNGLILDNYQHLSYRRNVEEFFHRLAAKVNDALAKSGFPECTGGVMARERKWCRELNEWKSEVRNWIKEADSQEVRDFTIFIDYRPVYGDFTLAENLRDDITDPVKKGKILHAMLMKDTIRFRVPINALGRISVSGKKKTIDLKKSALMQIINGVRIFAIRYGIKEVSTIDRLNRLEELEIFHPRDVKNAKLAMDYLFYIRLRSNLEQFRANEPLTNLLSPQNLDKDSRKQLKEALFVAKRLQQMSELSFQKNRGI